MSDPNIASRFDEIYNSTHKSVLLYITSKCGRTADISDIFQNVYMELYQVLRRRGADYIINDTAFVMRLARRKVARYYSLLERLRMFVSYDALNGQGDEVDFSDPEADGFLIEDFVVDQEDLHNARRFIHTQPEAVQKVFYLFYELDLTIPQIARALSIGESNVKNKLYRTLKELKNLLK